MPTRTDWEEDPEKKLKRLALGGGDELPIHQAIRAGDIEAVRRLARDVATIDVPNPKGFAPILLAANAGSLEMVRILAEAGADLSASSIWGTPLDVAVRSGHREIVVYLLTRGADPCQYGLDDSPFWCAVERDDIKLLKILLDHANSDEVSYCVASAISLAMRKNRIPMAKTILDRCSPCPEFLLQRSLLDAVEMENEEAVSLLLDYGADPRKEYGVDRPVSPLDKAKKAGNERILRLFTGKEKPSFWRRLFRR